MKSLCIVLASIAAIGLNGCASTGVTAADKDNYMTSKQGAAGMFTA